MITGKEKIIREKLQYLKERKAVTCSYELKQLESDFEERHAKDSVRLDMITQARRI